MLFVAVPILEVFLLIQVGSFIGVGWTIFLVILTAVLGSVLLRIEGLATLFRLQRTLERGELPAFELLEGALLLIGGALLVTPGLFTDTIGFTCLLPYTRRPLIRWFLKRGLVTMQARFYHPDRPAPDDGFLEGRYRRLDDD